MAKILLIDDEVIVLEMLRRMVATAGHEAEVSCDGGHAIERIRTDSFDLIISDLRMSPVDGMTVLAATRKAQPDTPVIMLTAYGSDEARAEAEELGVTAFLTKPVRLHYLLDAIEAALRVPAASG